MYPLLTYNVSEHLSKQDIKGRFTIGPTCIVHPHHLQLHLYILASMQANLSLRLAYNKCADQPVHQRSLMRAFAILVLESVIFRFATSEISISEQSDLI